jgi:hypothetical protein
MGGTGEVAGVEDGAIRFRPLLRVDDGPGYIDVTPGMAVQADDAYEVTPFADGTVRITPHDADAELVIRLDTTSPLFDPPAGEPELHIEASAHA